MSETFRKDIERALSLSQRRRGKRERICKMNKQNCYKCRYKEDIPGDAHVCCEHPEIKKNLKEEMFACLGVSNAISPSSQKLNIRANAHGVEKGWFNWPVNFDPVWLENCDGFEEKD